MKKEVVIQFSGGIDSLYAAHHLAPKYDKIHLVTFNKGYLHFALKANQANIDLLKSLHGEDKFVYSFIDIKELFKEMAVKTYKETKNQYGNEIAWCVPCRASMMLRSIIYTLENEIPEFTDGANWEQAPDGERVLATADNYPEFLEVIKSFAREYKVSYLPVLYDLNTRKERRDELLSLGAKIDFNSLDRKKKSIFDIFNKNFYKRYQPICLSGYLIHWKRNFFNVKEEMTAEMTVNSIGPKLETIGKKYINDYFVQKGLRVEEIVAAR
jgi:7-cyano-7-deazaguanine synthase in queuosine biosynthesis